MQLWLWILFLKYRFNSIPFFLFLLPFQERGNCVHLLFLGAGWRTVWAVIFFLLSSMSLWILLPENPFLWCLIQHLIILLKVTQWVNNFQICFSVGDNHWNIWVSCMLLIFLTWLFLQVFQISVLDKGPMREIWNGDQLVFMFSSFV